MHDTRAAAAQSIGRVIQGKAFDGSNLPAKIAKGNAKDIALYRELCFGTLRQFPLLDAIISLHLQKPLPPKHADVRALLAIGCYQLFFMRIPDYAALSSAVDASRALKKPWSSGMVNGVLRKVLRETRVKDGEGVISPQEYAAASGLDVALRHSQPQWLFQSVGNQYPDNLAQIFDHNNHSPVMALRLAQPDQRESYLKHLQSMGVSAHKSELASSGLLLEEAIDVNQLPGFGRGDVSVQDCAAQLVAELIPLTDGDAILDACAAPGGKTLALLQAAQYQGVDNIQLTAIDIDNERLKLVDSNLERAGTNARLQVADGSAVEKWWDGKRFNSILLDAPCSGTGVINRHPDIKLLRRATDIARFANQQTQLLNALWKTLAPEGLLLYCTCSIMAEENQRQIEAFLEKHEDAELEAIRQSWGVDTGFGRQLLPNKGINDGFFFAKIRKQVV